LNFLFLETLGYESALRVSGHHYARLIARRGHRALSLSAPVTPFHRFARAQRETVRRRFEHHRWGFIAAGGGVHHYVPWTFLPLRNVYPLNQPWALRLAARGWLPDVEARLRRMRFTPDVISLQQLAFYPLLRRWPGAIVHYRMTDLMAGFVDLPASFHKIEDRLLEEADLISITSRQFMRRVGEHRAAKTLYAPNGVDLEHFARPHPRPSAFGPPGRPIVLYVGALRAWFDGELLRATMRALPKAAFFVVSPDRPPAEIAAEPNFHHVPGVDYEALPGYYQHALVTIIPFRDAPLVAPVNPIKLFESLAAGTPVVAVAWRELKEIHAPIGLAGGAEDFIAAVAEAVDRPKRVEAGEFLRGYSWEANVEALLERIGAIQKARSEAAS